MEQLTHANEAKKYFLSALDKQKTVYTESVIREINTSIRREVGCVSIFNRQHPLVIGHTISYLESYGYKAEYDNNEGVLRVSWE